MDTKIIEVEVPQSTLYLSGTVNGVACEWINTSGNTWQTTAERSLDDRYNIALTIVSASGTTTTEFTLLLGTFNLITDRTFNDVNVAKRIVENIKKSTATDEERAQFFAGLKGYYNATDLNRVEGAVSYLYNKLNDTSSVLKEYAIEKGVAWDKIFDIQFDANNIHVIVKLDWDNADFFDVENQERYLANVRLIGGTLGDDVSYLPTSFRRFDYNSANNVERSLVNLNTNVDNFVEKQKNNIDNISKSWYYSNEIYGGELN